MKNCFTILFVSLLFGKTVSAQQPAVTKIKLTRFHQVISAGPVIPLAGFSETHWGGITANYIRKIEHHHSAAPYQRKKTGWLAAASLSHFPGKKENTGLVSHRYKGYSLLELNAGASWYPDSKWDISLRTGPAIGYYNKIFRFTLTGHMQVSYPIGSKTIITPGIALIKETGSDALWVTSLQLGILF